MTTPPRFEKVEEALRVLHKYSPKHGCLGSGEECYEMKAVRLAVAEEVERARNDMRRDTLACVGVKIDEATTQARAEGVAQGFKQAARVVRNRLSVISSGQELVQECARTLEAYAAQAWEGKP